MPGDDNRRLRTWQSLIFAFPPLPLHQLPNPVPQAALPTAACFPQEYSGHRGAQVSLGVRGTKADPGAYEEPPVPSLLPMEY